MNKTYIKLAIQMLRSNWFFASLSITAIAIAVMIVLIMSMQYETAIISGPPEINLHRTVSLHRGIVKYPENGGMNSSSLDNEFASLLKQELKVPVAISQYSNEDWSHVDEGGVKQYKLVYTDADYWKINSFKFDAGRPFTSDEVKHQAKVAVVSKSIASKVFADATPLGRTIDIMGTPHQVIGVVQDVSSVKRFAAGDLWAPFTNNIAPAYGRYLGAYTIMIMGQSSNDVPAIKQEVKALVAKLKATMPEGQELIIPGPDTSFESYFRGWGSYEEVDMASSWLSIMGKILAIILVPALNLIAINVMWIGERHQEIGLRKAFGASRLVLVKQLLTENTIITLTGGAIGLVMAICVAHGFRGLLFREEWGDPANFVDITLSPLTLLVTLLSVFTLSLLSGLIPAIRAAHVQPATVLKGGAL